MAEKEDRFAALWETFRDKVIPVNAPDVQKREMKVAFYAGAFELLQLVVRELTPDEEPTEQDIELLDRLDKEIRAQLGAFAASARAEIAGRG